MASSNYQLASFFKEVEANLNNGRSVKADNEALKKVSPETGDCFFVIDFAKNEIVHFGGMNVLFGYDLKNIDLPFIFDIIHPDDSVLAQALIKNIITQLVKLKIPKYTNIFKLKFRFIKSNGQDIRVLGENFVLQLNKDNLVQTILIRFTDVSFLDNSDVLDWWVNPDFLNKEKIAKLVYGVKKNIFTDREKEIILLIFVGLNNKNISGKLNISHHTVATHRKNIMSKSDCSGVDELKTFCKKNGVFDGR